MNSEDRMAPRLSTEPLLPLWDVHCVGVRGMPSHGRSGRRRGTSASTETSSAISARAPARAFDRAVLLAEMSPRHPRCPGFEGADPQMGTESFGTPTAISQDPPPRSTAATTWAGGRVRPLLLPRRATLPPRRSARARKLEWLPQVGRRARRRFAPGVRAPSPRLAGAAALRNIAFWWE